MHSFAQLQNHIFFKKLVELKVEYAYHGTTDVFSFRFILDDNEERAFLRRLISSAYRLFLSAWLKTLVVRVRSAGTPA